MMTVSELWEALGKIKETAPDAEVYMSSEGDFIRELVGEVKHNNNEVVLFPGSWSLGV